MIGKHEKAFSFNMEKIGCVNPQKVAPMVNFTIPRNCAMRLKAYTNARGIIPYQKLASQKKIKNPS